MQQMETHSPTAIHQHQSAGSTGLKPVRDGSLGQYTEHSRRALSTHEWGQYHI